LISDAALPAVGENEAGGGTDDGGGDGEPSEELSARNSMAHEDDEERNGDRENLSGDKIADGGGGGRSGLGLLPGDSEQDDEDQRQHPEEITPTGSTDGGAECEEVDGIRKNSGEENETKDKRERAKPGGKRIPGAPEEGEGEREIPGNVEHENLPEEGGLLGLPARGGVEEIKIGGDSNDGDLEEVEDAEPTNAGGILVGRREKHHENGSGPQEEQDVGGPGNVCGAREKTLVVGADGHSQGFEREANGEKEPELARVTGRAARDMEGASGSKEDHSEVEGIGEKEACAGGANKFEVQDEKQG